MLRVRHFPKWLDSRLPVRCYRYSVSSDGMLAFFMEMQLMVDSSGGGKIDNRIL